MRTFLFLVTGILMTQATLSSAVPLETDDFRDQQTVSADMEYADGDAAFAATTQGWNKWTCTSRSAYPTRFFRGSSYYFRPGSGEGQQAKRIALKIAVRNCESSGGRACSNNPSNCQVTNQ